MTMLLLLLLFIIITDERGRERERKGAGMPFVSPYFYSSKVFPFVINHSKSIQLYSKSFIIRRF
jgi:hypothetical protein